MEMTVDCLGAQRWSKKKQLKVQQLWSETHTLKHTHRWQAENSFSSIDLQEAPALSGWSQSQLSRTTRVSVVLRVATRWQQ